MVDKEKNKDINHTNKDYLSFITCGSVDDGKSTLIGRLLYEGGFIPEDLRKDIEHSTEEMIDFSKIVDGLKSEIEQSINIDVTYCYFSKNKRSYTVVDCPDYVEFTKNMTVGASNAHLAVVLIDSSKGISAQTINHLKISSFIKVKNIVITINKMDIVGFSQEKHLHIVSQLTPIVDDLGFKSVNFIPISSLYGDNVIRKSSKLHWYQGNSLLDYLEKIKFANFKLKVEL